MCIWGGVRGRALMSDSDFIFYGVFDNLGTLQDRG